MPVGRESSRSTSFSQGSVPVEKGTAESGASSARMQITRNRCWLAEKDIVPDNRVKKENLNGATRSNRMFRVSMLGYLSSWTCAQCLIERLPNILS
jgi:hypothetical protein